MTPEQMRIAVAEELGWKPEPGKKFIAGQCYGIPPNGSEHHWMMFPDYPNDLNACAEMENELDSDEYHKYRWILWDLSKSSEMIKWNRNYLSAGPLQRVTAFLKVRGRI